MTRSRSLARGLRWAWVDLLLVVAFCLPAMLPLAGPTYFFEAHDARHQVFFFLQFDAALRDGVLYPGWGTHHALGYGYPTFVYYPPLAFYTAEVFHLLGAGMLASVKWTWALATLGAGLGMYALARHLFGRRAGLLAAVAYVYAPYHLTDIYVRAALAEYCAFVWLPVVLLAFHSLVAQPTWRRLGLAGLASGALFLTHHVTGLVFFPVLALYVGWRLWVEHPSARARGVAALRALGGAALGLAISSALMLPSFLERSYIQQEQWTRASYGYAQHFVYPFQFLSPFWGFGYAGPGPHDDMSFQLGVVLLLLGFATVVLGPPRWRGQIRFWAAVSALVVLLVTPLSAPLWDLIPLAALVQFPWRLLGLGVLALAILAAPLANRASGPAESLVLCLLLILGSFAYTLPQHTPVAPEDQTARLVIEFELEHPDMVGMTTWTQEQPASSPLLDQYLQGQPPVTAGALTPEATVEMLSAGGASDEIRVSSPVPATIQFYTYTFPGWRVYLDGDRLPDSALRAEGPYGLITLDVPAGEHTVRLRWGDTPLRRWSKAMSLASLLLALGLLFGKRPTL